MKEYYLVRRARACVRAGEPFPLDLMVQLELDGYNPDHLYTVLERSTLEGVNHE